MLVVPQMLWHVPSQQPNLGCIPSYTDEKYIPPNLFLGPLFY